MTTQQNEPLTIELRARMAPLTRAGIASLAEMATTAEATSAAERALAAGGIRSATALALAVAAAGGKLPLSLLRQLVPDIRDMALVPVLLAAVEGDRLAGLLDLVEEGHLSWQREACLLYLSTQIAERPAPRRLVSTLRALAREPLGPESGVLVGLAALALDDAELNVIASRWLPIARKLGSMPELLDLYFRPPLEVLPEQERDLIATVPHTVLRAEPKIGRNDPCPCGSGRKYKKCCAAHEQETIARRSPLDEFRSARQADVRDQLFDLLAPGELAQIDPRSLTTIQLIQAFRRLIDHHRWADSERFIDEIEIRGDTPGADPKGYRPELIDRALAAKALDVADRQISRSTSLSQSEQSRYATLLSLARKAPDAIARLESALVQAHRDDPGMIVECALALLEHYPAIGILAARGAISAERLLDSEFLLEEVERARDRLDLPAEEPWWEIYDFLLDGEAAQTHDDDADADAEIDALKRELAAASARAGRLQRELSARQSELEKANARAQRPERASRSEPDERQHVEELESERRRLRQKIEAMKGEIASGSAQRTELRRNLARLMAEQQKGPQPEQPPADLDGDEHLLGDAVPARPRKILIPEFSARAADALASLPTAVAAAGVQEAARLAAGDERAWSGAKHMRRLPDIQTVRLGRSYRLLYRVDERRLEVVDVIHRRDLDTALDRMRK